MSDFMNHEIKLTSMKAAGGAATYVATHEITDVAINKYAIIDLASASQWAAISAGLMTALYFAAQFGYTLWKWRNESKRKK